MMGGVYGRRVTVVAGPGNNGADGRLAAQLLTTWGVKVEVVAPDGAIAPNADLVIDAAFGTGANRTYVAPTIDPSTPVLAVDIPSGIDGLTGVVNGSSLIADRTVCFAALKPGLLLGDGPAAAGQVVTVDIGLDTTEARAWLFDRSDAQQMLPVRAATDHKWKRAVWVIGGSDGMTGAPVLAARAALRAGAGMVRCSVPGATATASPFGTEVVFHDLPVDGWHEQVLADEHRFGTFVIGPGLGRADAARRSLNEFIAHSSKPLVLDADALHMLDHKLGLRPNIVLTPHDGEFQALTGGQPPPDRFDGVRALAADWNATVLLKGPTTIVSAPDGNCLATDHGDQRLATAGTGDVLAGTLGSYLAAGLNPDQAAILAAWMHAEAGHTQTSFGMVASDLVDGLAEATRQLVESQHRSV